MLQTPTVFSTTAFRKLFQTEKYCINDEGSTILHWICIHSRTILDKDYWFVSELLEFAALQNKFGYSPAEIHLSVDPKSELRGLRMLQRHELAQTQNGSTLCQECQRFMHKRQEDKINHI